MQLSILLPLIYIGYTHCTVYQNTTHYRVNNAELDLYLFGGNAPLPDGTSQGEDTESTFHLSVQGTNDGALPVSCHLEVENPGSEATTFSSPKSTPFECNDNTVTAIWTRSTVMTLNGSVTVQLQ